MVQQWKGKCKSHDAANEDKSKQHTAIFGGVCYFVPQALLPSEILLFLGAIVPILIKVRDVVIGTCLPLTRAEAPAAPTVVGWARLCLCSTFSL